MFGSLSSESFLQAAKGCATAEWDTILLPGQTEGCVSGHYLLKVTRNYTTKNSESCGYFKLAAFTLKNFKRWSVLWTLCMALLQDPGDLSMTFIFDLHGLIFAGLPCWHNLD
ncbi:hypothetical protein N7G274_009292 [Stereocaulon virgatum]|uniref:Uncharacterized protein n=1 Tax=Stereocaulon virgatum TaxID=373712 RepID=A0ABR4A148_9LECA